jgi:hypothetical protein
MSSRIVVVLGLVLVFGSVVYAQQQLDGKAPQQPAAGPPSNLFGGAAPPPAQGPAAAPTAVFGAAPAGASADSSADGAYIEDLKTKKVIFKANVKGKMASLLVGEAFTTMNEEERTKAVRAAYKCLVLANDAKFKSPMTIFLSDGQRLGPRLGVYTITPKGDSVKYAKPRALAGPVDGPGQFCPGVVPACPDAVPAGFCP